MLENILEKIETLPPLPQTIEEIETFRKKQNKEVDELNIPKHTIRELYSKS